MFSKVYFIVFFLFSIALNCLSQSEENIGEYSDSNPPPLPKPYLIIDSTRNHVFKEYGLKLVDIKTNHCGTNNLKGKYSQTIQGDTLTISVNVAANCCRDFIGRIKSDWGESIEVELFRFGNDYCMCNCNYVFDFIILITKEHMWRVDRIVTIDDSKFTLNK